MNRRCRDSAGGNVYYQSLIKGALHFIFKNTDGSKIIFKKICKEGSSDFKKKKRMCQFRVGAHGDDGMHSVRIHLRPCPLQPRLIRECQYTVHGHVCVCVCSVCEVPIPEELQRRPLFRKIASVLQRNLEPRVLFPEKTIAYLPHPYHHHPPAPPPYPLHAHHPPPSPTATSDNISIEALFSTQTAKSYLAAQAHRINC